MEHTCDRIDFEETSEVPHCIGCGIAMRLMTSGAADWHQFYECPECGQRTDESDDDSDAEGHDPSRCTCDLDVIDDTCDACGERHCPCPCADCSDECPGEEG